MLVNTVEKYPNLLTCCLDRTMACYKTTTKEANTIQITQT
jgi:hypothetical protein